MKQFLLLAGGICCLASVPTQALAATRWCVANRPEAVFCEDWDRYCAAALTDPAGEACPDHSNNSEAYWLANAVWQSGSSGCSSLSIDDAMFTTAPFAGRANSSGDLGNSKMPLGAHIRNKFGAAYTQMIATDLAPVVLEYIFDSPSMAGKTAGANIYMELADGLAQPITDYILSDNCVACGCVANDCAFPLMCRQSPAPRSASFTCPPIATASILPSIACGAVAYLDSNPCHCGEAGEHFSYNTHLNFFDGKQWWILKQTLFPGTFQGSGNFVLYPRKTDDGGYSEPGANKIRLTLKSATVKIELDAKNNSNNQIEHSECVIPRQYLGSFNLMTFGYAEPCRLKTNGTWDCATVRQCVKGAPGGSTTTFDNIALVGGMGYTAPGACCIVNDQQIPPSISCTQAGGAMDCTLTHGGQFQGPGTVCGAVPCCPPFLPDHDMDQDVDLEDFGWFQTCLSSGQFVEPPTIPCKCANLDGDADVDTADFVIFANCLSGPGTTANPNCLNG